MGTSREVVIVSWVRTAIGDYGGSLKDFPLVDLAASVVADAIKRADVDASKEGADGREHPRRESVVNRPAVLLVHSDYTTSS